MRKSCSVAMSVLLWLVLLSLGAAVSALAQAAAVEPPVDAAAFGVIADYYEYDHDLALRPQEFGQWPWRGPQTIYKVSYRTTHELQVSAYFCVPKDYKEGERRPAVLLMHGWNLFWGKNEDWVQAWIPVLTAAGYVVLAPDHFLFGERKPAGGGLDNLKDLGPYYMRDWMTQTVVDLRRGIDYLQSRPEVDPARIAVLGGSLGGWIGSLLSAVEPRIKAAVLTVPASEFVTSQEGAWSVINAANFYGRIKPPLLVVNALKDDTKRVARSRALFERVPGPKKMLEYDEGHFLDPAKYNADILAWLKQNL